ncbi:hypothetical protein Q3G72_013585 [Acer saccharum]|nr:hypothetical protein Q3G72_013585 [Acer saccharum]
MVMDLAKKEWHNSKVKCTGGFCLAAKLKVIKKVFKKWQSEVKVKESTLEKLESNLSAIEARAQSNGWCQFSVWSFRKELKAHQPAIPMKSDLALLWCWVVPPMIDLFLWMVTKGVMVDLLKVVGHCCLCFEEDARLDRGLDGIVSHSQKPYGVESYVSCHLLECLGG